MATLQAFLQHATGYDPVAEPAFQWSESKPCSKCGTVTATAVISYDGETYERLCGDCVR